ncbi:MAG: SPOR domain-containing protein [Gemmobacter sp.]
MLLKVLAFAGIAVVSAAQGAVAQDLRGPREVPGPGYVGQQYVDSAGCVFLRAGINGRVTWVARVDRQRRQLCGYPSSRGTSVAAAPPVASPAPAPVVAARRPVPEALGGPIDTVASLATPPRIGPAAARPVAAPAPAPAPVAAPQRPVVTGTPGCPAAAPYGERRVLPDGRLALLCGRDPVRLAAFVARVTQGPARAAAPEVTQVAAAPAALPYGASGVATGGRVVCPAASPVAQVFPLRGGGSTVLCTSGAGGIDMAVAAVTRGGQAYVPVIPRGYVAAWDDDRLNPRRGVGTAEGQMAQDQVWTREVPARLVSETGKGKARVVVSASNAPVAKPRVTTSTSTAPVQKQRQVAVAGAGGGARLFVQVGSFGVPSNADGARARLSGLGLPVAGGRGSIKGKPVQVVYAGPFGSVAQAQAALSAARRAGFGDAFIR